MIWQAAIWVMWKARNDRIFNNGDLEVDVVFEEIQVLLWRWILGRADIPACMLYEWKWYPEECLKR